MNRTTIYQNFPFGRSSNLCRFQKELHTAVQWVIASKENALTIQTMCLGCMKRSTCLVYTNIGQPSARRGDGSITLGALYTKSISLEFDTSKEATIDDLAKLVGWPAIMTAPADPYESAAKKG